MRGCVVRLALLAACYLIVSSVAGAAPGRGLAVTARTPAGKEVALYQDSYALLVGASRYQAGWPVLESVPAELERIKTALEVHGFKVTVVLDPDGRKLLSAFEDFIDKYGYDKNNRLVFFFSGHGYTRKNGQKGYLVPVDAPDPRQDEKGFLRKAVGMNYVLTWCRTMEAKHALFLFDSCFSGTIFKTRALPETPPHISDKTARPVRQFISAGSAGQEVPAKSIFVPVFLRALEGEGDLDRDGYLTGTELGMYLHRKVMGYESGQTPQYGKIKDPDLDEGDMVFPLMRATASAPAAPPVSAPEPEPARLFVDPEPGNAKIRILNIGPAYSRGMALARGRYHVEVSAPGYVMHTTWLSLETGGDRHVAVRLKKRVERPSGNVFTNAFGMRFVRIAPGIFTMGSPPEEPGRNADETPHRVRLLRAYYLQTTEVTQKQWERFMGNNPSKFQGMGGGHPVENVSWNAVQVFIAKLNQQAGADIYRLPTEAEWEYAARARTTTPFSPGRCLDTTQANYKGNAPPMPGCSQGAYRKKTVPVASFAPNAWGLFDMHGNVDEWCQDWYGPYPAHSVVNPGGPAQGLYRIKRGGRWNGDAQSCRSARRSGTSPGKSRSSIGFRLAITDRAMTVAN